MPIDLLPHLSPDPEKYWLPDKWSGRHSLVVILDLSGADSSEIAEITGYSKGKISQILNDPRAQVVVAENLHRMQETAADVTLRMKLLAHEALDEVVQEMRADPDSKVRQKAAFGILDRAGYSPIRKHQDLTPERPDSASLGKVVDRMEKVMRDLDGNGEIVYDGESGEREE